MELWKSLSEHLCASLDDNIAKATLKRIHFKEIINDHIIVLKAEDSLSHGWFKAQCLPLLHSKLAELSLQKEFRIELMRNVPKDSVDTPSPKTKKSSHKKFSNNLSPDYTFDTFIPGCNDFVFSAASTIVEERNAKYNPLIIVGGLGTGKTHLAQSMVAQLKTSNPELEALYTTSEDFTNEFIEHLQKKNMDQFRNKYRKCDLLVIDDIQGLQNRDSTTDELENIFNSLISHGGQMVFTSDRPVKKLKDLNVRLRSRLSSGLAVDLKNPDFETRKAILLDMAQRENHKIDSKIIDLLAETIDQNIRELRSNLIKLFAYADLKKKDISLKLAKEVLSDRIQIDIPANLSVPEIMKAVAVHFGIKASDIKSDSKLSSKAHPRQIAMYLATKHTKYTSTEIGNLFGKSHSTVIRSTQKIDKALPNDINLKRDLDKILLELAEVHH